MPVLVSIGGIPFFQFECDELSRYQIDLFSRHSCLGLLTEGSDSFLKPLVRSDVSYLPRDIAEVLKYKGKTSTVFTRMMLNMALCGTEASSNELLTVLDPMCGKGTTLFCAMEWGLNADGIEINRNDLKEIMDYLDRYFQMHRLKYLVRQGSETVGKNSVNMAEIVYADNRQDYQTGNTRRLRLFAGDTALAGRLIRKRKADVIVADLPYGIQHAPRSGQRTETFEQLLTRSMPSWYDALRQGGILGLSFNVLTLKKKTVQDIGAACGLAVMEGDPFDDLIHDVDQSVRRDAVFLKKE